MAKHISFDDQTFESLNYNSDSDPDFDPCDFYVYDNKPKKIKKRARRSSSPVAGSSENALCVEQSTVIQIQEVKNIEFVDSSVQVNARNFPRKKSTKTGTARVTRSKKKVSELSVSVLETLPKADEVSSQSISVDETINEPLIENMENLETPETSLEPQTGPENTNHLYMQNTLEGLTSSRISLETPSVISGLNSSNNENHAEAPSGNQEIKKTIILNISLSNVGNNMNQRFSIAIPMDDQVQTLNLASNPENMEMDKEINEIPSTPIKKKKGKPDSSSGEKKSHKKKSKGKKKYSKKRSKYYSSDSECSCCDCLSSSSSYYTSSSEDECCRKYCSCSKKDVKEKSSKK